MKCFMLVGFSLFITLATNACLRAQDVTAPPASQNDSLTALRAVVDHWEKELAKTLKLRAKGYAAESEVDRLRGYLAKVRHDLALAENNSDAIVAQTRILAEVRERELQRLLKARGSGSASEADVALARRRQACAHYLVAE